MHMASLGISHVWFLKVFLRSSTRLSAFFWSQSALDLLLFGQWCLPEFVEPRRQTYQTLRAAEADECAYWYINQ